MEILCNSNYNLVYKNPWEETENFHGDVKKYYDNLFKHFSRFRTPIFVETGTYIGNGLNCAIKAGFKKLYSIEIHEHLYTNAVKRFANEINTNIVKLYHGNSEILLSNILNEINERTTFWLDAHISSQYGEKLAKNCPALDEIDRISKHHIKNHTILIDDINCFGNSAHDNINIQEVIDKLMQINPKYKIEFLDAHVPNNIMVCYEE